MKTAALSILLATLLLGCQQSGVSGSDVQEKLPPKPLVEPIDPIQNPVAAVKANEQQLAQHADVTRLRAELLALVHDTAADNVQQCRVVGVGSKPCGGPAYYLAVSVKSLDEQALMSKVAAYGKAARLENERLGLVSTCAIEPEPAVSLQNGKCVLGNSSEQ